MRARNDGTRDQPGAHARRRPLGRAGRGEVRAPLDVERQEAPRHARGQGRADRGDRRRPGQFQGAETNVTGHGRRGTGAVWERPLLDGDRRAWERRLRCASGVGAGTGSTVSRCGAHRARGVDGETDCEAMASMAAAQSVPAIAICARSSQEVAIVDVLQVDTELAIGPRDLGEQRVMRPARRTGRSPGARHRSADGLLARQSSAPGPRT